MHMLEPYSSDLTVSLQIAVWQGTIYKRASGSVTSMIHWLQPMTLMTWSWAKWQDISTTMKLTLPLTQPVKQGRLNLLQAQHDFWPTNSTSNI